MKTKKKQPPPLKSKGKWKLPKACPGCDQEGTVQEKDVESTQIVRKEEIQCVVPQYVCSGCECTFASPEQATRGVKIAIEVFKKNHDQLTASESSERRKALGLSVSEVSKGAVVSVATIKRIEAGGHFSNESTNKNLREFFTEQEKSATVQPVVSSASPAAFKLGSLSVSWESAIPTELALAA